MKFFNTKQVQRVFLFVVSFFMMASLFPVLANSVSQRGSLATIVSLELGIHEEAKIRDWALRQKLYPPEEGRFSSKAKYKLDALGGKQKKSAIEILSCLIFNF